MKPYEYCPKCGAKDSLVDEGDKTVFGTIYIAEDTSSSTEYASGCARFRCVFCEAVTIMEKPD